MRLFIWRRVVRLSLVSPISSTRCPTSNSSYWQPTTIHWSIWVGFSRFWLAVSTAWPRTVKVCQISWSNYYWNLVDSSYWKITIWSSAKHWSDRQLRQTESNSFILVGLISLLGGRFSRWPKKSRKKLRKIIICCVIPLLNSGNQLNYSRLLQSRSNLKLKCVFSRNLVNFTKHYCTFTCQSNDKLLSLVNIGSNKSKLKTNYRNKLKLSAKKYRKSKRSQRTLEIISAASNRKICSAKIIFLANLWGRWMARSPASPDSSSEKWNRKLWKAERRREIDIWPKTYLCCCWDQPDSHHYILMRRIYRAIPAIIIATGSIFCSSDGDHRVFVWGSSRHG